MSTYMGVSIQTFKNSHFLAHPVYYSVCLAFHCRRSLLWWHVMIDRDNYSGVSCCCYWFWQVWLQPTVGSLGQCGC